MLTSDFRKSLATKAHTLSPVVRIGQKGLTAAVHEEVNQALLAHELIKVKLCGDSDEKKEMVKALVAQHEATLIQAIGHVAVFYRFNPEKKRA